MNTPIAPPPPSPLTDGEIVGHYRILSKLGEGGMGAVHLAEHIHMRTRAVVKVLHPQLSAHAEVSARFVNEARTASALKHRNIVTVHDCGQRANGQWFIAMEFLDGSPLSRFIESHGGPIALPSIVHILGQAANGLNVAHDSGIVHRDVKPENLFLVQLVTNPHHVTVLDFGIAKIDEEHGGVSTKTNTVIGTPTYMAPEQLRASKDVDRRADIYALGVIAWEMTTGCRLWGDLTSPGAIMEQQVAGARPLNPCHVLANVPPAWGAVVAKALAFRPEDRWPSAQAFALALAHALPGSDWNENGVEILRRYANELTIAETDAETAGRPVPVSHVGTPTVRAVADGATPLPVPQMTPAYAQLGRPPAVATVPQASRTPGAVPIVIVPAPAAATPGQPTTLGGATGQSMTPATMPPPPRRSRAQLVAALGLAGLGAIVVVAVTVGGGETSAPGKGTAAAPTAPAAPTPVMSALAVITEPPGAVVIVDGVAKGAAPLNLPATVGTEVEIRAELVGHVAAVERVRVGAEPATVRLVLVPLADAAVDAPAAPIDAGTRRVRPRPPGRGSDEFDPDSVVQP